MYKWNCDYVRLSSKAILERVKYKDKKIILDCNPEVTEFKENIEFFITFPLLIIPYWVEYVNTEKISNKFNKIDKKIEEYMKEKNA